MRRIAAVLLIATIAACGAGDREAAMTKAVQSGDAFDGLRSDAAPSAFDADGKLKDASARCAAKIILDADLSDKIVDAYIDDTVDNIRKDDIEDFEAQRDKLAAATQTIKDDCTGLGD